MGKPRIHREETYNETRIYQSPSGSRAEILAAIHQIFDYMWSVSHGRLYVCHFTVNFPSTFTLQANDFLTAPFKAGGEPCRTAEFQPNISGARERRFCQRRPRSFPHLRHRPRQVHPVRFRDCQPFELLALQAFAGRYQGASGAILHFGTAFVGVRRFPPSSTISPTRSSGSPTSPRSIPRRRLSARRPSAFPKAFFSSIRFQP